MKHSIKWITRIRLTLVLFFLILLSISSLLAMLKIHRTHNEVSERQSILNMALDGKRAHYAWAENLSSSLGLHTEFTGTTDYTACDLGKWLYSDHTNTSQKEQELIAQIIPLHQTIHTSAEDLLSLQQTNPEKAKTDYINYVRPNITKLVSLLDEVIQNCQDDVIASEEVAIRTTAIAIIIMFILFLFSLFSCIRFSSYIKHNIILPLLSIQEGSNKLRKGELDFELSVDSNNEVSDLANNLNESVFRLREYILEIERIMIAFSSGDLTAKCEMEFDGDFKQIEQCINTFRQNLQKVFAQMKEASSNLRTSSSSIAQCSEEIKQGVLEQKTTSDMLSNIISSILEQVQFNATQVSESTASATVIGEEMRNSNVQISHLITAMEEMTQSSSEISSIIKTIEDISFQTNILALNAAVEAARAGVAGKGFAVVADEVKNLASRSSKASQMTAELINRSVTSIERGSEIVTSTANMLKTVEKNTTEVIHKIHTVADSYQKQVASLSQLKDGLQQITHVIHANSITASTGTEDSDKMATMARELDHMLQNFQLEKGSKASI